MNLLLIEIDGVDCVADSRLRVDHALAQGDSPTGPRPERERFWHGLFDPARMAQDKAVTGAYEFLSFLAQHSWKVVLLTHRRRSYGVYSATHAWLVAHGFDPFFFELVFPEQYHSGMSKAEWKLMKLWTFSQEAGSTFSFRRIVFIEPNDEIRQEVQEQWSGLSESPLDAYNGLTAFSSCIALREQRAIIAPLLELHRAELEREQVNASPEEVRVLLDDSDETIEEDIEEEDVQEEEIVRPRKQRAIKSSLPDDLLDEGQVAPRKKQAKGEKWVRQARRNLKSVAA